MSKRKSNRPTSNASAPAFVEKLQRVKQLQGQAKTNVYKRTTLLIEVYDDPEWRERMAAEAGLIDDLMLGELLDEFVDDSGFEFLQLRAILERFPKEADWRKTALSNLWEERKTRPSRDQRETPAAERWSITRKEVEQLQRELGAAKRQAAEAGWLRKEVGELTRQLAEAHQELTALRAENDQLRAALTEPVIQTA
jgi:uncharacterized coiled-coil DUF342 family protein